MLTFLMVPKASFSSTRKGIKPSVTFCFFLAGSVRAASSSCIGWLKSSDFDSGFSDSFLRLACSLRCSIKPRSDLLD